MNRFLKVVGTVLFGLAILIGVPGYYFVNSFDLNKYKSYAADLVEKELGRKLTINGEASIGISLVPTIIIQDVELANASWATKPEMIKVESLEVKFALTPLFKKQIVIDKVVLIKPEVFLEIAPDGRQNWDFSQPKLGNTPVNQAMREVKKAGKAAPATALIAGFAAKNVSVENGLVQYNDLQSKQSFNLVINGINMSAESMDSDLRANFDVVYDNQRIKAQTFLGSINRLMAGNEEYPVNGNISAYGVEAELAGNILDMFGNPYFAFNTNIYNPAGNLNAPEITLKATIEGNASKIKAHIQALNVDDSLISGNASVDISGKLPYITADLKSNSINLPNFSKNSNLAFALPSLISEAQASNMVPDTLIPYGDLKSFNAKLMFNIKTLIIQSGMIANNVVVGANLQNGILNVNPLNLNFGGGDIDGTILINANNKTLVVKAVSKNMLLQNLHKEFVVDNSQDFGVISGGQTDINLNLTGSGDTYRQVVKSLNGQAIVIVDKSKINTGSLKFMEGNFITQILNALKLSSRKDTTLNLQCAVVRADFRNGQAVFPKGIAINAKQMTIVSDGNINLGNDKLDFSIRPFSGKIVDANVGQALSSFVKVRGTLDNPKIVIDDAQAIKAIVGVITTGPAYIGSQIALDADSSPCYTALKGTPYENRFPKPTGVQATGQEVYQDTSAVVDQGLKDLKKTGQEIIDIFRNKKKKGI